MGVAKDECASACAEFARGMPGCCVWQEDWKKCVFVPRETTKQNAGLRAGVECTVEHGLYQLVCNIQSSILKLKNKFGYLRLAH